MPHTKTYTVTIDEQVSYVYILEAETADDAASRALAALLASPDSAHSFSVHEREIDAEEW